MWIHMEREIWSIICSCKHIDIMITWFSTYMSLCEIQVKYKAPPENVWLKYNPLFAHVATHMMASIGQVDLHALSDMSWISFNMCLRYNCVSPTYRCIYISTPRLSKLLCNDIPYHYSQHKHSYKEHQCFFLGIQMGWAQNLSLKCYKSLCVIYFKTTCLSSWTYMTTKNYHSLDLINCNLAIGHVGKVYI